jgi:outer membrane protein OmpA-like peptidoglycan-associated protein
MKKELKLMAAAAMAILAVGCSSAQKMVEEANNVKVTCDPAVLEAVAGNVDANVTVTYPEKYFLPKAVLEVTPVLVYNGGEAKMSPFMYQGEKVKDNYKVIAKTGGTVNEKVHFDYVEGMEESHLELRGVVKYKNKSYKLPTRKVADGVNTTYMLVDKGVVALKDDGYQAIIKQTAEGQILYNINSANVRSKELKGQSVKDFQSALDEIQSNERKTLVGTEVVAYASPDGGQELNQKLSDRRSESADKAWDKVMKDRDIADPEVKSVGQDWEGFQELVQNSDIEDKDLILRVLSMYSDPAVRESEIKNMSNVYTELKSSVLPELRRARFIANVEYKNYTTEELLQLVEDNEDVLDEPALLHAATLVEDEDTKVELYNKAIDKYDSDVARYNLAATYLNYNEDNKAEKALENVETKDEDYENALGVIALRKGNYDEALKHFKNSGTDAAQTNIGILDILQGDYSKAVQDIKNTNGCPFNRALAYLLNGQVDKASTELGDCQRDKSNYLRAVIAARQGNSSDVKKYLDTVKEQNKDLYERSETDIEFAEYR